MTVLGGMFERMGAALPPDVPKLHPQIPPEVRDTPSVPRYSHWRVIRDGKVLCSMIGEPMTEAEALEEVRFHWPSAEVARPDPGPALPITASSSPQSQVNAQELRHEH